MERNFEITKIEKVLTKKPLYRVYIFNHVVTITANTLLNFKRFQQNVFHETNQVPSIGKPVNQTWADFLNEIIPIVLVDVVPLGKKHSKPLQWDSIVQYLQSVTTTNIDTFFDLMGAYHDDKFYYVRSPGLCAYLQQNGYDVEPREIWALLQKQGIEHRIKPFKTSAGWKRVRVWCVPAELINHNDPPKE